MYDEICSMCGLVIKGAEYEVDIYERFLHEGYEYILCEKCVEKVRKMLSKNERSVE